MIRPANLRFNGHCGHIGEALDRHKLDRHRHEQTRNGRILSTPFLEFFGKTLVLFSVTSPDSLSRYKVPPWDLKSKRKSEKFSTRSSQTKSQVRTRSWLRYWFSPADMSVKMFPTRPTGYPSRSRYQTMDPMKMRSHPLFYSM